MVIVAGETGPFGDAGIEGDGTPRQETDFNLVAEQIRPNCIVLDEQWVDTDALIKAAKIRIKEINDDMFAGVIPAPSEQASNRTQRKVLAAQSDMRRQNQRLEVLALVIRRGTRTADGDGFPIAESMPGYVPLSRVIIEDPDRMPEHRQSARDKQMDALAEKTGISFEAIEGDVEDVVTGLTIGLVMRYRSIYQRLPELTGAATAAISGGIESATSFADWLDQVADDQDGDYRAYLQMLASDLYDKNDEPSQIILATEQLRSTTESHLHADFIETLLSNPDASVPISIMEWLGLIEGVLSHEDGPLDVKKVATVMANLAPIWPADLQSAYQGHAKIRVDNITQRINTVLQKYLSKQRLNPSADTVDQMVRAVVKPGDQKARTRTAKRPKGASSGRVTMSPTKVLPSTDGETLGTSYEVARLKQTPNGFYVDDTDAALELAEMISRYAAPFCETGLDTALAELLAQIRSDPFGPGTKKLKDVVFNINGKPHTAREATTRKNQTVSSSGNTAYRTRIVYVITEAEGGPCIAVREILHHNDMDAKYLKYRS